MTRHAKAVPARSTEATGSRRGLFGRAFAFRAARVDSKGTGARSGRRLGSALAILALAVCAFAIVAAPASAEPPGEPPILAVTSVTPGYSSIHVTGTVNPQGHYVGYYFQYSTDGENWETPFFHTIEGEAEPGVHNVSEDFTGLLGGGHYFVRLSGYNVEGDPEAHSPQPYPQVTTLVSDPPSVVAINNASQVEYTTAKLTGEINRPSTSDNANCNFEYITDAQFTANQGNSAPPFEGAGVAACEQNPISAAGGTPVSGRPVGLTPGTTYHLRLTVTNSGGSDSKVAASTFTTLASPPKPTVVSVDATTALSYTTATLNGHVKRPEGFDPGLDASCNFEYITDAAFAGRSEKQRLKVQANGGTFKLSFADPEGGPVLTTGPIARGASPATVQAALQALANIGPGGAIVTGGPVTYVITFGGALANRNIAQLGADGTGLIGTGAAAEVVTLSDGHAEGFESAQVAACNNNPITASSPPEVTAELSGLANNTTYHVRLVLSNVGGTDVKVGSNFTTLTVTSPIVKANAATSVTGTTAHFSGEVTTGGEAAGFGSSCFFDYVTQETFEAEGFALPQSIECAPNFILGTSPVTADVTGLLPNTTYHLRLRAQNQSSGGPVTDAAPNFLTESIAPLIGGTAAHEIAFNGATLTAQINPGGAATTYHFEYLTDAAYQAAGEQFTGAQSTPESAPLSADNATHLAFATVGGLEADTVYRFRVIATNAKSAPGGTIGPVASFRTAIAAAADSCPNAEVRAQQVATFLPECRAYELVSPVKKYASEAGAPHGYPHYAISSPDGNRVVYGTFGPVTSTPRGIQFTSRGERGPNGWTDNNPLNEGPDLGREINAFSHQATSLLMSRDMTRSAFIGRDARLDGMPAPESLFGAQYAYAESASNELEWMSRPLVAGSSPPQSQFLDNFLILGGTPSLSTIWFRSLSNLLPADQPRVESGFGGQGLYEYNEGVLTAAGILPDDSMSPAGASPATGGSDAESLSNIISQDGTSMLYTTSDPAHGQKRRELYLRHGGHSTLVSHAANGVAAADPVESGVISPDGSTVFFLSQSELAPGAPPSGGLYSYSTGSGVVSYVPGATTLPLPGAISASGKRFLFGNGFDGYSLWNEGTVKVIAPPTTNSNGRVDFRTTASGSVFYFNTAAPLAGANTGNVQQLFRYDVATGKPATCISCPPDDVSPSGSDGGVGWIRYGGEGPPEGEVLPKHGISADGSKVFFDSADPLLPADINGKRDVYQWSNGRLSLITSGRDGENSFYMDNSPSGNDVFIGTANDLVGVDNDGVDDTYDVRVGGGFLERVFNPCAGEGCRSAPSGRPTPVTSATTAFSGAGNRPGDPKPRPTGPKVKVGAHRLVGGSLGLTIRVPRAGQVTVTGSALEATEHTYAKSGKYQLEVPLTGAAKSSLRGGKQLKLKIRLRFSPKSGKPSINNVVLTVKA